MLRRAAFSPRLTPLRRLIDDLLAIAAALGILLAGIVRPDVPRTTRSGGGNTEATEKWVHRYFASAGPSNVAVRIDDLFAEDDLLVARMTIIAPIAAASAAPRRLANSS